MTTVTAADYEKIRAMVAAGDNARGIGDALGVHANTIIYTVRKRKLGPWVASSGLRKCPADFATVAIGKTNDQLAVLYSCNKQSPARWRVECGLPAGPTRADRKQMPEGFAEFIKTHSVAEACKRFALHKDTARRFRNELGVPAARPMHLVRNAYQTTPVDRPPRDMSAAGQACDYLRRFGPVSRCDDRDGYWRRGSAILTGAELIERAERLGWTRDAWAQVKAA